MNRENDPRVVLALGVTVLLWASSFIVIRYAGSDFGPGSMALLRMVVGAPALGAIAARRGVVLPPRRAWPLVAAWGVAWFCGYNVALNAAERMIDAGTAAIAVNLAPLLVVLAAGVILKEGFPPQLVVGAPVAFAGVALISTQSFTGRVSLAGLALALAAAGLYAGSALAQKHLLRVVDATTLTWLGATAGTVALLPWTGQLLSDLGAARWTSTLSVVYLGVFPTAIAFTTWAYALMRTPAGRTAASTYVVPTLTVALSWALLGEVPGPVVLLGGAVCLAGVFVTRLPSTGPHGPGDDRVRGAEG
ncbi:DMT family transporter [Phycicoccus sp. CSK15P-2]|uniref:DMT family transporter n=1 Tax=Phycicoccus sp. CSK15P-2 TaxID=2807627 RepID=UPI00194FD13F|nr:DMT family transporter [Phycicoccus sp. CSK15P-2]MBM6406092.1 DMT family transporter [Phycicoccus sp. CSK15P-2]